MVDISKGIENCGSEEIYWKIIQTFCKDGHKRVKNIEDAVRVNDMSVFALETHSLKSVAATIGAVELAAVATTANRACKKNEINAVQEHGLKIIGLFRGVIDELEKKIDVFEKN